MDSETSRPGRPREERWRWVFGAALLLASLLQWGVEPGAPMWLDEAWTIAVVGQHRWVDFFHQVYWDVNAPLYLLILHLWQVVFGLSDLSLRMPSLIFAGLTPILIAVWRVDGVPTAVRLTWAAVVALWFPALSFAQEARCYAFLLLISAVQCLSFIQLVHRPTLARATLWAAASAAGILTHYDAIFVSAAQGLTYLVLHRVRALRTWPAAFAFAPAFGWLAYHSPRIVEFARPEIAWYAPLGASDVQNVLGFVAGRPGQLWALAVVGVEALALRFAWPGLRPRPGVQGPVWSAVLAAVFAACVLITWGALRPSFAIRYLTPDAPGLLLGIVLGVRALAGSRIWPAFAGLIASYAIVSSSVLLHGQRMAPSVYNYEIASRYLEAFRPSRVVFLWDHPVTPILHTEQLDAAGGVFFRRDGELVSVDPVIVGPDQDPNRRLVAAAKPTGSVILWVYDTWVKRTAAAFHPPAISALDASWVCRQFGRGRFGVYACARRSV